MRWLNVKLYVRVLVQLEWNAPYCRPCECDMEEAAFEVYFDIFYCRHSLDSIGIGMNEFLPYLID